MAVSSVGAAGPVAAVTRPAVYLPHHTEQYRAEYRRHPVGTKTAHLFLKKLRQQATGEFNSGRFEASCNFDLTNVGLDVFNWRAWIAGRLHGNTMVVGPGIERVMLVFLTSSM